MAPAFLWVEPASIALATRPFGDMPLKLNPISIAVVTALAAFASNAALAQETATLERVEITGSRILSANAASPAPIQVLSSADIAASGAVNLQELLLKSPVFGTPGISRTNSNFSTSSAGVATVDLRNLGSDRTLVLVNGRRFVAGVSGSATVDLNSIPTDFIERIEILTGGASATYGSDAVGGVVNLILKRNFQGLTLDAQVAESGKSDDKKKKFSATFGTNAADGKANIMTHFSVSQEGAVFSRDRSASAVDQASTGAFVTGDPADIFKVTRPFYSSFAPQGRFFYQDGSVNANGALITRNFTYDASGNRIPFSSNGPAGDGVGATGFNRSAYRTIAVPTDRLLLATKGDFALNDSHSLFFEGTYAATKTKTRLEPFALDSANVYQASGGLVPAEFLVNGVKVKNPIVPAFLYSQAIDRDGDGLKDYNFTRRLSDVDVRSAKADRDTVRVVAGLKGELSKVWSYDTYLGFGQTKDNQYSTGQVNILNFRNALEAIPDVNDLNNNGSTTDAICRDAEARAQGCVPINVFGADSISKAAAAYVNAPGFLSQKVQQKFAGVNVNGEPFENWAGPVGFAFGAEYRKESSSDVADALTQAGLNAGNARPITEGSFDVKEAFAEVRMPLLKNLALVKTLDATAAVRAGKYSTVGNVTSWNAGLDWAVNSMFRVRFTSAVSTRAPNIGELYQGASQTFPSVADPCDGVTAAATDARSVACKADPSVAANIAANGGVFTLNQADLQGTSGYDRGNPNLKAEKGRSNTLGMVITPKAIPLLKNFTFTADYYDIKITDAISTPGRQYQLDQCYGGGNTTFCSDITRRKTAVGSNSVGSIEFVDQTNANTGGLGQRGVDLTASYATKLAAGDFNARLAYTYLIKAYSQPTNEADLDYSQNEVGSSRNRWTLNLGYSLGNWGITGATTYIGKAYLDDQFLKSNFDVTDPAYNRSMAKVAAKTYFDLQTTYTRGKAQVYFGINNLFDTKAPPIITGLPGNTTGAETDAGTYDAIGRRFYVGLRYSM
jgi:outer membrane receptor protein involved in Fe transport